MTLDEFELCVLLNNPDTPSQLLSTVKPVLVDGMEPVVARQPHAEAVTRQQQSNLSSRLRTIHREVLTRLTPSQFDLCVGLLKVRYPDALLVEAKGLLVSGTQPKKALQNDEQFLTLRTEILAAHQRVLRAYAPTVK